MVFTCVKCDTRSAKPMSKKAYEKGVVLVRCPGCQNLHVVADRLGWFGNNGESIEDWMKEKGQVVMRGAPEDGTLEITPEMIAGGQISIK